MAASFRAFADELSKISFDLGPGLGAIPGVEPGTQDSADSLTEDVPHGTHGRLLRLPAPGARLKMMQGPRAYGPRIASTS